MLLTQCFQNLFEHEIFFFFPRKTCLTDFRNVWSESTSAIGITWTCVQTIAPNPRLCTLSSLQIRGKHCCWGQCRKGWGTDRSPLTPATSDKRTCLSVLSTAVMNTTTKSSLGGGVISAHNALVPLYYGGKEAKTGTWMQKLKQSPRMNAASHGWLNLLS